MASPSCHAERCSGKEDSNSDGVVRAILSDWDDSCPLEALNSDCLLAILRAISSLDDLSAFIRSSPAALRCFASAKALILRDVMANELGPAIRDALIMSLTDDIDLFAAGSFNETFDIAINGYKEILAAYDEAPWVPIIDEETAIDTARLTRMVLYFVDIYIRLRTQHFGEILDGPGGAAWRASRTERGRIAQALLRFEIIVNLHHPSCFLPPSADRFFTVALELFSSWELEQISEMGHFILALMLALQYRGETIPPVVYERPRRNGYSAQQDMSLPEVYAWLVDAQRTSGSEFMDRLMRDPVLSGGKLTAFIHIPCLMSSHRWLWNRPGDPPAALLELLEEEPHSERGANNNGNGNHHHHDDANLSLAAAPAAGSLPFDGESLTDPPWAWVHAWRGRSVRRWGTDLVPERPPDGDWDRYNRVEGLVESWRWLGMVFWDRDRVEALLKTKVLEGCRPGWLADYLDSVTNVH
ncbi:hypothetical protein VTH82DRAFT_4423 [Thermothelomyces myriococcoides]